MQGDVEKIIDANGVVQAIYSYDPWGKILSITNGDGATVTDTHIAKLNGLRYRGYHGDNETQWYYLQSRYYDPFTRRFVNADSITYTGQGIIGTNMFAYCGNNPVIYGDSSGHYYRPAITAINDGGSGLSSAELTLTEEMRKHGIDIGELPANSYESYRLQKRMLIVNVSGVEKFLCGDYDYGLSLGIAGSVAGYYLTTTLLGSTGIGICFALVAPATKSIVYSGMPDLPNGIYEVYELDVTASKSMYTNNACATNEMIEFHNVTTWYVMKPDDSLYKYIVTEQSSYAIP